MPSRSDYPTMLDCKHVILLNPPPTMGDEVFCRRCNGYRFVVIVATEWSVRCDVCRYGRKYGADEESTRRAASRHADIRTHAVWVRFGGKAVDLVQPSGQEAHLPEVSRWLQANPSHSQVLKNLRP